MTEGPGCIQCGATLPDESSKWCSMACEFRWERDSARRTLPEGRAERARLLEEPETGFIMPPPEPAQPTQRSESDLADYVRRATVEQLSPEDPFSPAPPTMGPVFARHNAPPQGARVLRAVEVERDRLREHTVTVDTPLGRNLRRALADAIPVLEAALAVVEPTVTTGLSCPRHLEPLLAAVSAFGGGGEHGAERASRRLVELRGLVGAAAQVLDGLREALDGWEAWWQAWGEGAATVSLGCPDARIAELRKLLDVAGGGAAGATAEPGEPSR